VRWVEEVWGLGCGREVEGLELGARPLVGGAGVVDDHAGLDLFWVARHGGGAGETPPSLCRQLCSPLFRTVVPSCLVKTVGLAEATASPSTSCL
jgi:hypothetical protein